MDFQKDKDKADEKKQKEKSIIKHLVLAGGGPSGIQTLGVLQHLEMNGYWSHKNIESIYSTSVGCIIAILIALKFDWTAINDYIIKRPWHDFAHLNIDQVFGLFSKKGLYDVNMMHLFFKPFFNSKDVPLNITMKEFYALTNVDLHFFSLGINHFQIVDISYKTMPDMEVLSCAYMSATIPLIFSPICSNGESYIDGGMMTNYPLKYCIQNISSENLGEILGIKNAYEPKKPNTINYESTMIEFILSIISNLISNCQKEEELMIPNEVLCETSSMSLKNLQSALKSQEIREELLQSGIKCAKVFLETLQ
jgi:predicted patatin/cPLA2 family phospholipase